MRIRGANSLRPATCGGFKRDGSWVVQRTRVRWFLWRWMNLRTKPSGFRGSTRGLRKSGVLVVGVLFFLFRAWVPCSGQGSSRPQASGGLSVGSQNADQNADIPVGGAVSAEAPEPDAFAPWQGLPVRTIAFEGVPASRLEPLAGHLPQAEGAPFDSDDVRRSLRQLFATGLYESIEVTASRAADGVALVFKGTPRTFLGTVSVDGARGSTMNTQLVRASQLAPGTRYTPAKLNTALEQMRSTLAENGFHEPKISRAEKPVPGEQLIDVAFHVTSGPQTRIGKVEVTGDPAMTVEEFRRHARLRSGALVDHETANRALSGVLKHYRNQGRLEAEIKLESAEYDPATKRTNFRFSANQGPRVRVTVQGIGMTQERIRHLIPVYEEGTVDEDLLNEGNRRVRDFYQRLGYFDVKVAHQQQTTGSTASAGLVEILFTVTLGPRRRLEKVAVAGNHYFDSETLKQLLTVHAADTLDRHGTYSQALVSSDVSALQGIYQNNGFSKVKITPATSTPETFVAENRSVENGAKQSASASSPKPSAADNEVAPLTVTYHIEEGPQVVVGVVKLEGADQVEAPRLRQLMNTTAGQLLSPRNLAGDRDALVTDYLSRGFEHAQVDVAELPDPADAAKVDVTFRIVEGPQFFVRKVLLTGLRYTRPQTVARAITIHAGDPLNQTALMDTQRNLYEFALFNEVDPAVENPTGGDTGKTILLQTVEARRWALTYGGGFEVQTGTPHYNCGLIILSGAPCITTGKTGISPRVLVDITRNNLFGREQSASLQGTYGLLEQKLALLFQIPHFENNRDIALNISGGYANSLDVTTYVASKLEGGVRFTERFSAPRSFLSKANSFVYEFNFRRVKVQANSLQVSPGEIQTLATAVRVGGPAITWLRDTRDSVLDAHRGTYTSFQEFLSDKLFGAQVQFNRLDISNSSYYSFDKGRIVLARNTRYGQERAFGAAATQLIPLPERLYAGGATSLRGFSINAAGPRDPETGYPIGGAGALINSTELRLPPPTLPFFGDALSFVIFHDMGNVFANASTAWESALRVRQPDRAACRNLDIVNPAAPDQPPPGPVTSTGWQGECSFNYFSHALGLGLRYHTPAGPIRLDFSYNLNPPIFPVVYNYNAPTAAPTVGEAGHFNFFFSLGQTF
jgi:outer membrane protein insertion porin family